MDKRRISVVCCEPFILPGILPTLGSATLKAEFSNNGILSKVFYPSLRFFSANNIEKNKFVLAAIENIPLQFSEFLCSTEKICESIDYIINTIAPSIIENSDEYNKLKDELYKLRNSMQTIIHDITNEIIEINPDVICHSFTFGDYNFASALFSKVKEFLPNIKIIVGGSNCTPYFSKKLLHSIPTIDYVICDETYETTTALVRYFVFGTPIPKNVSLYITTHTQVAQTVNKIQTIEMLPCPDFDDFMSEISNNNIAIENIILPYEISRGCWWGEKKPCSMCGYFGNQKCFLIKSIEKVNNDIAHLMKKYNVSYFRLTDLVEPHRNYLKELKLAGFGKDINLFWELRPNLTVGDMELLRSLGLFYAQVGLESLSTDALKHINKGTTAINNIFCLINLYTYKIHCVWNFLYGFEDDKKSWYEDAMSIMPLLYHLQPPEPRQVWINKCSKIYENSDKSKLTPIGNKLYYKELDDDFIAFFKSPLQENMKETYSDLCNAINLWREAFNSGYVLYEDVENSMGNELVIVREYEEKQVFQLCGIEKLIYYYFYLPHSLQQAVTDLQLSESILQNVLAGFVRNKIMIFLDGKYLSLATRSSKYRWQKFNVLPKDN